MRFKNDRQRKAVMAKLGKYGPVSKKGYEVPVKSLSPRPQYRYSEFVTYNGKRYNVWKLHFDGKKWKYLIRRTDQNEYSSEGVWVREGELSK